MAKKSAQPMSATVTPMLPIMNQRSHSLLRLMLGLLELCEKGSLYDVETVNALRNPKLTGGPNEVSTGTVPDAIGHESATCWRRLVTRTSPSSR